VLIFIKYMPYIEYMVIAIVRMCIINPCPAMPLMTIYCCIPANAQDAIRSEKAACSHPPGLQMFLYVQGYFPNVTQMEMRDRFL
jgi:hypothetical protein